MCMLFVHVLSYVEGHFEALGATVYDAYCMTVIPRLLVYDAVQDFHHLQWFGGGSKALFSNHRGITSLTCASGPDQEAKKCKS